MSTKYEENLASTFQEAALKQLRQEHGKYFEALEQHPRLLVGKEVPATDGSDRTERLRDENDARSWQDAIKHILAAEVKDRVDRSLEENQAAIETVHASIELFQKNPDLIPKTKQFDRELAERLVTLVKPYEVRVDGKLQGYSIPVQPIVEQLRSQVTAERAAKPASDATAPSSGAVQQPSAGEAPAGSTAPPAGASPTSQPEQPQAGIPSKATSSSDGAEDFGDLFATINPALRNMRI